MAYSTVPDKAVNDDFTEQMWDLYIRDNINGMIAAWTDFTPTVNQSAAITITVTRARYLVIGKTAFVQMELALTSAGTAANSIAVNSIPSAIAPFGPSAQRAIGAFFYKDNGAAFKTGTVIANSASQFIFMVSGESDFFGKAAVTVAAGDILSVACAYEIA
jgi:hypothetical protein